MMSGGDGDTGCSRSERAPLAASRDILFDKKADVIRELDRGYKAAGVPGTVRVSLALQRHGKLTWSDVIETARKLAAEVVYVSSHSLATCRDELECSSVPDR